MARRRSSASPDRRRVVRRASPGSGCVAWRRRIRLRTHRQRHRSTSFDTDPRATERRRAGAAPHLGPAGPATQPLWRTSRWRVRAPRRRAGSSRRSIPLASASYYRDPMVSHRRRQPWCRLTVKEPETHCGNHSIAAEWQDQRLVREARPDDSSSSRAQASRSRARPNVSEGNQRPSLPSMVRDRDLECKDDTL